MGERKTGPEPVAVRRSAPGNAVPAQPAARRSPPGPSGPDPKVVRRVALGLAGGLLFAAATGLIVEFVDFGMFSARPGQADVRAASETKLKMAWSRMANGVGPGGDQDLGRQMASLMQLAEFSVTSYEHLPDGTWRCGITFFVESHGKTPNLRFRVRFTGYAILEKDSGAWVVRKFDRVTGMPIAGGEADPDWGTK